MTRLNRKRTLITGGTTGIGLEAAKQFLNEGARVIVTGNNPDTIAQAKSVLGSEVPVIKADSASVQEQQALAAAVKERYGQLDVAFLNAGISIWQPIESWTPEVFDRIFAINVKGPYFLIQALLPVFANPASVVLNTSISAHVGAATSSVYGATKAAFLNLSKTLSPNSCSAVSGSTRSARARSTRPSTISSAFPMLIASRSTRTSSQGSRPVVSAARRKSPRRLSISRPTTRHGRSAARSWSTAGAC